LGVGTVVPVVYVYVYVYVYGWGWGVGVVWVGGSVARRFGW
jgi:hypothetical protein